jgi:hypothetical protein
MSGIGSRRNPDCPTPDDHSLCRVTFATSVQQPTIDWTPVYDGHGTITNSDPNTFLTTYNCTTCSMSWETTETAGTAVTIRKL